MIRSGTKSHAATHPASADVPLLSVSALIVRYGAVEALRGVDLEIAHGRAVAVVGPNGAGKTTLLRAISGLVRSAAGRIELEGRRLVGKATYRIAREGFVHVPEGRRVIEPLTVEENLLMGAYTVTGGKVGDRMEEMLELFPALRRRLTVAAGLLSGGEQQMLAIARGLMSGPRLLAIDEPSMGLAPVVVDDVLEGLQRAIAAGVSLLLVEQNVALAREIAEQFYVMVNGEVALSGGRQEIPEDLLQTYVESGGA